MSQYIINSVDNFHYVPWPNSR